MSDSPRDVRRQSQPRRSSAAGGEIIELRAARPEVAPYAPSRPTDETHVVPAGATPSTVPGGWQETWYRDLFDGLPTATLVTTLDGVVTHANTAACLLFRRPPQGLLGHPVAAFVPAPHRAAFASLLERARLTAHVADFALSVSPSDAALVDCRVWVRRIVTFGDPAAVLAWTLASLVPEF